VNVERLEVEEKIDSDYQPVVIWLKVNEEGKGKSRKETERKEIKIRSEEKGKELEEEIREMEIEKEGGVEQGWEEMKERIGRIFKENRRTVRRVEGVGGMKSVEKKREK